MSLLSVRRVSWGRRRSKHISSGRKRTSRHCRDAPRGYLGKADFVSSDLRDAEACARMVQSLTGVTHVVYTAVHEKESLAQGWTDEDQIAINSGMLRNFFMPLLHDASHLRHVTLLQGAKAYGAHVFCTLSKGPAHPPVRLISNPFGRDRSHRVTQPPLNAMVWPTMKSLSLEARKRTSAACSAPSARRRAGTSRSTASRLSGSSR